MNNPMRGSRTGAADGYLARRRGSLEGGVSPAGMRRATRVGCPPLSSTGDEPSMQWQPARDGGAVALPEAVTPSYDRHRRREAHRRRASLGTPPRLDEASVERPAESATLVLRQRAERWGIADAARTVAWQLHSTVEHPDAPFPDSSCAEVMAEAKRLADVVEVLVGARDSRLFLVAGMVEACLYEAFEETARIKAMLAEFGGLNPEREREQYEPQLREQLQIRVGRLASASRLLVAHIHASALDPTAGGEDEQEDEPSLQLHPACRWFWLENFPTQSTVSFSALWSACGRQAEFGQLTQDAKRRLFEIARPAPRDELRSSPRIRNDYISLHDLDVFTRANGLASLTVAGSSPSITVQPTYKSSVRALQSHPSAAPLEVSPACTLQELRRLLPEPRKGAAYNFTCRGLPVAHREEPFVRVCDAVPLVLRVVSGTQVAVDDDSTSQIPFASMFQRRIASYEQPQTREWSGHDACTGIHVLVDPCPVQADAGLHRISAADGYEGEDEDEGWQLDVVLVPGVRTSSHRQFFWEENGLIDHLRRYVCDSNRVRVLGVEHRAAGLEPSVWTSQTTAQHISSTVGVLRRLLAVGVGDRPVVFITDNVGSLIVQQLLLLPCSSQSRDVTQDAVAICEATLALIHFAAPMVGLTESCTYAAQKLAELLPTRHLPSQGYAQHDLHEKVAYIALVQDDFAFAQRSEQCLRGLLCLHMSFQSLDRPHVQLGTGIFANRVLQYGTNEYTVRFESRSADSVSRPCSRTLGQTEEMDDNILLQLITEALCCAASFASEAFGRQSDEMRPLVQPEAPSSPSSPRDGTQRLSSPVQASVRTISRRAPVVTQGTEAEVALHVSILLRGRTHQVMDGVADDISGLCQLPSISGAPKPFEFMFVALHVAMAEIVRWLGGSWSTFFSKVSQETPALVIHLFGESRQLCLARTWLIHTLSLPQESGAVTKHSSSTLRCIYDLDPFHTLDQIFGSVSRAEAVVSQLQSSEAHGWWWSEQVEKRGVIPTSSYARNLTSTPMKIAIPGPKRTSSSSSSEDEGNAVEGSTYARSVRRINSRSSVEENLALVDDELDLAPEQKTLGTTTVVFLGRAGAGKTTLLALLLQDAHALLDSCACESTRTTVRFCGCASAEEEEFLVEYMSSKEVDAMAADLNNEAQMMCHENGISLIDRFQDEEDIPEPAEAIILRNFATSLQAARQQLSGDASMQIVVGDSARPVRRVPLFPPSDEAVAQFKKYTQQDSGDEASVATEIDLVCRVTVRLHLSSLRHLTLLDTPGRSRAAGAQETNPREMLRQRRTQRAIEEANCWVYLLPWFQQRGIQQLEEDMQCWRAYIVEAEGFVVLTRMAEDGFDAKENDYLESVETAGARTNAGTAVQAAQRAPTDTVSMESRLADIREKIRTSRWCSNQIDERYTVSPSVSSSTGVLAGLIKQNLDFADEEDFQEEIRKVVTRISSNLLVEPRGGDQHGFLGKLDKEHYADACLEVCGVANVAEILCGSATHFLAHRSVTDSVSVHLHRLVKDDVAIDKDLYDSVQHLKAWDDIGQLRHEWVGLQPQIETGILAANRLMQVMKESADNLYFTILDEAEQLLAQTKADAVQEKRIKKARVQMELCQAFVSRVDRVATDLVNQACHSSRIPELLHGRFERWIAKATENAPDSPRSCIKPPRRRSVSLLLPVDASAEFQQVLARLEPLLEKIISRLADTSSGQQTDEHLQYDESSALFNGKPQDFVQNFLIVYDGQPDAGFPQGRLKGIGRHANAVALNATAHLWTFYRVILRTVLDELSEACGRQRQISDKSDALQRKLDRSDGLTMAEEGRQTVIVETEARICRLIELRRQLRRKEAEIVKICTECLMLDARNSIRDRAQVIAEDHRANAGCEWREANVAGTPSGRPRTGSVPGGRSRAVSRSSSTRSVLAGLSDSERRLWANLEINFSEVKLEKRIGAGAAGIVHRGTHLGQDVAVKILKAQEEMDDDERKDFHEECKWLSELRCSYIVQFMGVCTVPPNISVITEYLPRGSLYDILHKQKGPVDFRRRMRMLLDVIKGMQYLGFKKIVHRDLKSQNLLVDRSFKVKVADFGLARFSEDTHVKTVNGAAGTPAWMAPEVLRGDPFTAKADVYSFGVVVWETVVREVPWHGLRNAQIVCSVGMREERLPLTHAGFVKYEYLRTLCMACFAEAPQARPNFDQTCEAFTAFLQRLLQ